MKTNQLSAYSDYGKISELYKEIPRSVCKKDCVKCCSNMIQFTPSECDAMGGYEYDGFCSHVKNGKCSIYERRPFVCRIYGTSEMLRCNDCTPERFLSEEETVDIVHRYTQIKRKEEMKS